MHKLFLEDLDIVKRETIKKIQKIQENKKLSAEQKQKKNDKLINQTSNYLMKHAETYDKNPEIYKKIYLEKQRLSGIK